MSRLWKRCRLLAATGIVVNATGLFWRVFSVEWRPGRVVAVATYVAVVIAADIVATDVVGTDVAVDVHGGVVVVLAGTVVGAVRPRAGVATSVAVFAPLQSPPNDDLLVALLVFP